MKKHKVSAPYKQPDEWTNKQPDEWADETDKQPDEQSDEQTDEQPDEWEDEWGNEPDEQPHKRKAPTSKKEPDKLVFLAESAVMLALATVLSFVKLYQAPLGGSVTLFSMLPIMYVSYRYGVLRGLSVGFVYSLIQLWQGIANLKGISGWTLIGSLIFDYVLPFTLLGLAGLFYRRNGTRREKLLGAVVGAFLVLMLRFSCHFVSGIVLWSQAAKMLIGGKEKDIGTVLYSFVYNISYFGPEALLTVAATPVVPFLDAVLDKALNKASGRTRTR